jgi:hypothetical protein
MRASCVSLALGFAVACGSGDRTSQPGGGGSDGSGVLTLGGMGGMGPTCPASAQPSAGKGGSKTVDNVAQAMDIYERCASRCDQARAQSCAELVYAKCVDYCLGWENRVANGLCVTEIDAYVACRKDVTDPCAFPSGPVPPACELSLTSARCCLGLTPTEDDPK